LEKFLGLSTEDQLLNKKMLDREISDIRAAQDAIKEEGGDEESEEEGDMEF
jgi:hypothetical protein